MFQNAFGRLGLRRHMGPVLKAHRGPALGLQTGGGASYGTLSPGSSEPRLSERHHQHYHLNNLSSYNVATTM